jgi:hypothetical protein
MRKLWLACILLYYTFGYAQDTASRRYQQLISIAIFHQTFIDIKPLSLADYQSVVQRAAPYITVDTAADPGFTEADLRIFKPLLEQTTAVDTTLWRDDEIRDCALVQNGAHVDHRYALTKFQPTDTADQRYFDNVINLFNQPNGCRKWLAAFSRPVFDQTGTYAVLVDKSGIKNFGCYLYKWNGRKWIQTLNIATRN